jgi:hypothetical protein
MPHSTTSAADTTSLNILQTKKKKPTQKLQLSEIFTPWIMQYQR